MTSACGATVNITSGAGYVEGVAMEPGNPGKYIRWDGAIQACNRPGATTPGLCSNTVSLAPISNTVASQIQVHAGVVYWVPK